MIVYKKRGKTLKDVKLHNKKFFKLPCGLLIDLYTKLNPGSYIQISHSVFLFITIYRSLSSPLYTPTFTHNPLKDFSCYFQYTRGIIIFDLVFEVE